MAAAAWCGFSASDMTPHARAAGGLRVRALLCGACALASVGVPVFAQEGTAAIGIGQYGVSVKPLDRAAVGQTIASVEIEIGVSSGDPARDAAAVRAARAATAGLVGSSYRPVLVDTRLERLVSDGAVRAASYRVVVDGARGALGILVSVDASTAAPEERAAAPEPGFPVIYQDERTKLTFIMSSGLGVYSDTNAWFGAPELFIGSSPIAGRLPGDETTWTEGYLELGIGGATQIADSDYYLFGAASALFSASRGQTVFTAADRNFLHPAKGYVGLLYANPRTGNSAQLSLGRQTWTLNSGFLISMIAGAANGGERGATYLGPRHDTDFSGLFTGEFGRARFAFFYIDPDEIEDLESNTTFAGANLGYRITDALSADISLITIPTSDLSNRTPAGEMLKRAGTTTFGLHALYSPPATDHFWLEAEAYQQTHDDYDMSALAYYATVGYIRKSLPWRPSLSYRFASFSGDDPDTETYERFDPLMSTGLGNWLQGLSFGKLYRNANLNTHRIQANVAPRAGMNLTFTWHQLRADELNNLGGNAALSQLSSRDIGEELTATLRWAIDRNLYLQLVASRAVPGQALKAIGADEPWSTLQASLYLSY
jgi:hypothetical protein